MTESDPISCRHQEKGVKMSSKGRVSGRLVRLAERIVILARDSRGPIEVNILGKMVRASGHDTVRNVLEQFRPSKVRQPEKRRYRNRKRVTGRRRPKRK